MSATAALRAPAVSVPRYSPRQPAIVSWLWTVVALFALLVAPVALRAQTKLPAVVVLSNLAREYTALPATINSSTDIDVAPAEGGPYTFKITYAGRSTAPTNAGHYPVTVVATSATHTGTATGELVILTLPLIVDATDQYRLLGVANSPLLLRYTGFVGSETVSVLNRRPVATTLARTASPAGNYEITVTGGADNNYSIVARNPATLTILPTFPGTYETLLFESFEPDVPAGKLTLTLPAPGAPFTGRLELAREGAVLPLSGKLVPEEFGGATAFAERRVKSGETYRVEFAISEENGLTANLFRRDAGDTENNPFLNSASLALLRSYTKLEPAPWTGPHTLVLPNPFPRDGEFFHPKGASYATATVLYTGTLKLAGKFADGATLTAAVSPDADGRYRLFLRPYGARPDSFAAGDFVLREHPEPSPDANRPVRYYVPLSDAEFFFWRKAPKPGSTPDKLFPLGFGPLESQVAFDPWTPPAKAKRATVAAPAIPAFTLAQRLGLADDETTSGFATLAHEIEGFGESMFELPGMVEFTALNKTLPLLLAPPANPRAWKISVNATTGRFSGSFKLLDTIAAGTETNPDATRNISRAVAFQGTLRQAPLDDSGGDTTIGAGYFLIADLPNAFEPAIRSSEIRLRRPE